MIIFKNFFIATQGYFGQNRNILRGSLKQKEDPLKPTKGPVMPGKGIPG